jgi:hypothetical protein
MVNNVKIRSPVTTVHLKVYCWKECVLDHAKNLFFSIEWKEIDCEAATAITCCLIEYVCTMPNEGSLDLARF